MIPYGRQCIESDDIAAVIEVLEGDWLTQGPYVSGFEDALAHSVGANDAVSFTSGTAALHAAVAAAGLGSGDLVATSPLSFVASANCALFVGASAAFVDIDPATLNLDLAGVPEGAEALVVVHYGGLPVNLAALERRPRIVIEDAAHGLGAATPDGPVGNCARSDMCVFSFHPVKAVTTGEGGAVTTNDVRLATRLRLFRNHGIVPHPDKGGWLYNISEMGFNYRLTDIQSALGTSQLRKLPRFIERRRELAGRYRERLGGLPLELPPAAPSGFTHAHHLFPVQVNGRRRVFDGMRAAGIGVQVHYVPIYRHPLYVQQGFKPERFPATESVYSGLISLPLYPGLTDTNQDRVIEVLSSLL